MTNTLKKGISFPIVIIIILVLIIGGVIYFSTRQLPTAPPAPPACGDGICNGTETCCSCSADCRTCSVSTEYKDLIRVFCPPPNQEVTSPLTITGEARGYWFFEAVFPVRLLDKNGNIIAQTLAQAQGEWMTENFVPFSAQINFTVSETQNGTLVLEKDNPSDLPENAAELRIPVVLKKFEGTTRTIKLYYYNPQLDKDESENILCSKQGLVAVERQIPVTTTPIQDATRLLIAGQLTSAEKSQGVTTEYPLQGFSLKSAFLNNGVLTLEFQDSNNRTGGGSCRVGILWSQIEATAKQFPEVQSVRFLPEELFQP